MSKDHKNGRGAISAYAEEIKLSRISEGETMADLVATREALEAAKARIAELEGAIRSQPGNMTRQRTEALERSLASWDIGRELVEEVQALQIKLETATAAYTELAAGIRVAEAEGGAIQQANNEIDRLRAELQDIRESTEWLANVDPDEIRDEELNHAALIDFRHWQRLRGPGAVGNQVYSFEDFLIPHARAQGEKRSQSELATATTEIAERNDTIDALRNDIAELRARLL